MIVNLPKQFPVQALEKFDFGDAEAQLDPLLSSCPVPTSAIADFLSDKKDIVLGYRGTGKSALVRLLVEGHLIFRHEEGWKPVVLAINEEFSFQLIAGALNKKGSDVKDRKLVCRVIWEILLIYRALQEIRDRLEIKDPTLDTHLDELDQALGVPAKKPSLIEVLLSSKKKIGVKVDTNLPSVVDMYTSWEPAASPADEDSSPVTLRLIDYKKYLNRLLHEKKVTLYVLFDRLDDFVAQEEYDLQRQMLHGLLATQADYRQRYPRIKVKAFIRSDLFTKLDLSEFGPDKLLARSVSLTWSAADIKKFIAKRIALNLMQALDLDDLQIEIDRDECRITRDELALLQETKNSLAATDVWRWKFWRSIWWLNKLKRKEQDGRARNSAEIFDEAIITSILPTEVVHRKLNGTDVPIALFDYFDSHFQFGHGETTPRAMLSFLTHFLTYVRRYYSQNQDIQVVDKLQNGEYPLFVKKVVRDAYDAHRKDAWEVQHNWASRWKPLVGAAQRMSRRRSFNFEEFVDVSQVSADEARQFLAFSAHTGLIKCVNDREKVELRVYQFPILFQTVAQVSR